MVADTDILIVGAGLAGAATAYHLVRRTRARILVVEQETVPGAHSSGRNAAIVRERVDDPVLQTLMTEGAGHLRNGRLAEFERRGLMLLGLGDEDVRSHFPRARGVGLWCPNDGTVDVARLLHTYLAGVRIRFDTKVTGWTTQDRDLHVNTSRGGIMCRLLVNAAGPWAGGLGDLPLTPMNRHLFATTPIDWVSPHWPCVWDIAGGLYFRPEAGGLLLCCCDELPAEPGDYREDPAMVERLAEKVASLQPDLGEFSISSTWVGQRVFGSDWRFVIGFDPRNERVFHVAGLGGHGVTASYAVGRLAAELIISGDTEGPAPFMPSRLL
ncbi:MAG: FAD-binding oxidoreductase [Phycisphaerales bacterium]|nr:MAG: FAD-binding oxidoreductase [Phycisphaerales bacterium]